MINISLRFAAAGLAGAVLMAHAAPLSSDAMLVKSGKVQVDAADFEGNVIRIPEERRAEVRMSYDRVMAIVDGIFVTRVIADKARADGMDKDPAVQRRLQQVQDGVLADLYTKKIEKEAVPANLEPRLRELYRGEQAKYVQPEMVYVQHILVNLWGRTKEMAEERAKEVAAEARKGGDFLALAAKYSNDPDNKRHGGDLGYNSPNKFVEPVRKAIAGMKAKGEIAGPVESEFGYHIIKFIDRKAAEQLPYEVVRKNLEKAERDRLTKAATEKLLIDIRSSPDVTFSRPNIEALVIPVDPAILQRAMEESTAAAPK